MKALTYIEIDIPVCTRTYGVAPCAAAIGVTGAQKCFNTKKTCQDRAHYNEDEVTLRFARDTAYLPSDIDCIPAIDGDVSFTPATISLGENLGTRATLQVTLRDHPHSDTGAGFDPYFNERTYDPFRQGSLFGKFRARQPYLRGCAIRWITGLEGQALEDMTTRHFVIESFDGATPDGKYTLVAKDVLKLAAGDRSQAPAMNTGYLNAAITNSATSATLAPSGIGNAEYPASGAAVIGGNEIVSFTRSGDVLTIARGQKNTAGSAHNAQDRVQVILSFAAAKPADIIKTLLVDYAGIDPAFIPLTEWLAEVDSFLGRLYTADICEPTSVETLVNELIAQACLSLWWDDQAQKIRLQVLRTIVADAARFTPDNTLQGSLTVKEQPEKRISQVWTYFARINPLKQLSDTDNYRSVSVVTDDDAEADFGGAVISKVMSRWIPALGRTVADRLGAIQLGRFRDPPRRFTFDTMRYAGTDLQLGVGYRVTAQSLQDATGLQVDVPVQITRLNSPPDRWKGEAEEALFNADPEDLTNRLLIIDSNINNINLRAAHDLLYPAPVSGQTVTCRILTGVVVGSISTSVAALVVGSWPAGVVVVVEIYGRLQGAGGNGGNGGGDASVAGVAGAAGGAALYTRYAIQLKFPSGAQLWSGGGGGGGGAGANGSLGGGGGGGGGAGTQPGSGQSGGASANGSGNPGATATAAAAGSGGVRGSSFAANGGGGGGPGLNGAAGGTSSVGGAVAGGAGGAAGAAIDGNSYVTMSVTGGDRRGPLIN